ncbi:MAG: ATP-binding protein [Thermoleophilaceae bacterium]
MAITAADFAREFRAEGDTVEFKSGISSKQLQETVVAFSNARGGVVLVGVGDDGVVRGRALDAGTADAIHQVMRDVHDPGRYELHQLLVDERPVSVVAVARRREGFAQTSGGVVRMRRGTRDEALFGAELRRFINERSPVRFETTRTQVRLDAISAPLGAELSEAFGWSQQNLIERLEEAGYAEEGYLTVAGALYLLDEPTPELGKTFVEILRYRDDESVDYDRRDELGGPLQHQLRESVERVMDELGTELVVVGVRRYELARLPEVVVREAVANALAHRSYEINRTPVRIEIRPSVVRVVSPGGLPEPVTVQNMREASAPRNIAVIRALRRFGLAEDAGRGIDVMQDVMQEEMLDPPRFEDHGHEVVVDLPIRSAVAPVERAWIRELERRGTLAGPDRVVLVRAARGEALTNARVRAILQVDAAEARDVLQRLRDERFLEQHGQRGGATYYLSGSLRPPAGLRLGPDELADLVEGLADDGPITNSAVRKATGLDRNESLAILDRLVKDGRLIRTGQRRGTKYQRAAKG